MTNGSAWPSTSPSRCSAPCSPPPPSRSLHRIWRLPNLSLCNYLSGATCETSVTPSLNPHPRSLAAPAPPFTGRKISCTHAQRSPCSLALRPGRLSSGKESSARRAQDCGYLHSGPSPPSSGPSHVLSLFSPSSSWGGPLWPPRDHG